jgi:hypothetical protein
LWREVIQHQPVDVLIWSPLVQILLMVAIGCLLRDVLSPKPEAIAAEIHPARQLVPNPAPRLVASHQPSVPE